MERSVTQQDLSISSSSVLPGSKEGRGKFWLEVVPRILCVLSSSSHIGMATFFSSWSCYNAKSSLSGGFMGTAAEFFPYHLLGSSKRYLWERDVEWNGIHRGGPKGGREGRNFTRAPGKFGESHPTHPYHFNLRAVESGREREGRFNCISRISQKWRWVESGTVED